MVEGVKTTRPWNPEEARQIVFLQGVQLRV